MDAETIRDLRVEILRYLYARPAAAMPAAAIARAVRKSPALAGIDIPDADLEAQIAERVSAGFLKVVSDPEMPALKSYQIEKAGITHFETHHLATH